MLIDFNNVEVVTSFDGKKTKVDVAKSLGNMMKYSGSVLLDIGFETLAEKIYYSEEPVEVPEGYAGYVIKVVKESSFIAAVKRELIYLLTPKTK